MKQIIRDTIDKFVENYRFSLNDIERRKTDDEARHFLETMFYRNPYRAVVYGGLYNTLKVEQ